MAALSGGEIRLDSMQEEGVVIETHGKAATVRINKASACIHCKAKCMEHGGFMITEAENSRGAKTGDTVLLKFDPKASLTAALVVFGLPILALLAGVIVTASVASHAGYQENTDLLSIAVGGVLFLLAFIPVKLYDRHVKKRNSHSIAIVDVIGRKVDEYM